jgi:3-deoxy-7-phosphoheptulonate synthase
VTCRETTITVADQGLLLVFDQTVGRAGVDGWIRHLESAGIPAQLYRLGSSLVLPVSDVDVIDTAGPDLPAPTCRTSRGPGGWLWRRELRPAGTRVVLGPTTIGDGSVAVIAGPCAVETADQMTATAVAVAEHGAVGLRGGAFKPRTWPYSFQGLKWDGLDLLVRARERTGLPFVTEVAEPEHVKRLAEVVDGFQIGARNMQNFALLSAVGQSGLPVVLKRGFGCTVEETLAAGEYLLYEGNDQVVLCERGIRTFEPSARFTLDVTAVALWKQRTHLPVMADPSHAGGRPELVEPLSLAAVAAGADALLIDVHVQPEQALCDGNQALRPPEFAGLMARLAPVAAGLGRRLSGADTTGARASTTGEGE